MSTACDRCWNGPERMTMMDRDGDHGSQSSDATAGSQAASGGPTRVGAARRYPKRANGRIRRSRRCRARNGSRRRDASARCCSQVGQPLSRIGRAFLLFETGRQVTARPAASSARACPRTRRFRSVRISPRQRPKPLPIAEPKQSPASEGRARLRISRRRPPRHRAPPHHG
jgi:hypothetical protein